MADHASIRYAASLMTTQNSAHSSVRGTLVQKPHVTITLKGETEREHRFPSSFSTRDKIEGEVTIVAQNDLRFDDIYITFEGVVRVWSEAAGLTVGGARNETRRMFLKMNQPIDESTLPVPRIALKGVRYTFPFSFTVPDQLLDSNCSHSNHNEAVKYAHLQLPPSLGTGKAISHDGTLELDDVTPDMTKIRYGIKVRLTKRREFDNKSAIIVEEQRNLHVTPAYLESPPAIDDQSFVYRKEKDIKKGLFKGKLGRMTVEADPPRPMETKASDNTHRASTTVSMYLSFVPSNDNVEPPKLGNMTTKLKYRTFFSTRPINYFPQRKSNTLDPYLNQYQETLTLSSRALNGIKWRKVRGDADHDSTYGSRRGSDMSDSASCSSTSTDDTTRYVAEVLVPVSQLQNKALPPTFHSCYVSRQYELDISLDVDSTSRISTTFNLKMPVQVTAMGEHDLNAAREAEELPAFEEFFTPRSVAPPTPPTASAILPSFAALSVQEESGQLPFHMMSNSANMAPPPGYGMISSTR